MKEDLTEIVDSLNGAIFDIVYVSQRKENSIDTDNGLLLCEKLFSQYACSIVIITRNVFNLDQINLLLLQKRMQQEGKFLFCRGFGHRTREFYRFRRFKYHPYSREKNRVCHYSAWSWNTSFCNDTSPIPKTYHSFSQMEKNHR